MRAASIDIGSNTALLLIADIKDGIIYPLKQEFKIPRLGRGLAESGRIADTSIELLVKILKEYKHIIDDYSCEKIYTAATAALRNAENREQIITRVATETGILITAIDGKREAYLSYLGASYPFENKEAAVLDIGGGSTELIIGKDRQLIYLESFKTGVVSLTEKYVDKFPVNRQVINNMSEDINNIFTLSEINWEHLSSLTAIGGTPALIFIIYNELQEYDLSRIERGLINRQAIDDVINIFSTLSAEEILRKYKLIGRGREDVLLSGCLILRNIMDKLHKDEVTVTTKGLRFGLLTEYLLKISDTYSE